MSEPKPMSDEKTVRVTWYTCDCDWRTKYCEQAHSASADIPVRVLEEYRNG